MDVDRELAAVAADQELVVVAHRSISGVTRNVCWYCGEPEELDAEYQGIGMKAAVFVHSRCVEPFNASHELSWARKRVEAAQERYVFENREVRLIHSRVELLDAAEGTEGTEPGAGTELVVFQYIVDGEPIGQAMATWKTDFHRVFRKVV